MNKTEFMDTKEGMDWFRGRTKNMPEKARVKFKKWILTPPPLKQAAKRQRWYREIEDANERIFG